MALILHTSQTFIDTMQSSLANHPLNIRKQLLILVIISSVLFFLRLGSISVYQVAEARNAECAREMWENKDWIVPVFNGELRTDKPAMEYFAMMTAYAIGGVSEGNARFFSALCGLFLVVFTFLLAYKHLGQKAAWWAAMAMLASMHTLVQFRLATPDPYLVLCHTLALYCFIEGWLAGKAGQRELSWYAGMYIFLGLAMLAKGPVGLFLPALTILCFVLIKRALSWKFIRRIRPWWGIVLVLLFSAPWYILVHLKTRGAWTSGFFLEHNIGRFSGAMGGHGGIFLLTLLFVFAGMLPFSVFIIHTLGFVWKRRKQNDLLLFSLLAFGCVLIFYTLSRTKLINYTVPCYPFLAMMTGAFLDNKVNTAKLPKGLLPAYILLFVISIGFPIGVFLWTGSHPELEHFRWISGFFALFPIGTLAALVYFKRKKINQSLYIIAGSFMINTIVIFIYPYPLMDAQTPIRKAQPMFYPGRKVAAYKSFNNAFVFYTAYPIPVLEDTAALGQFLQQHPEGLIISDAKDQTVINNMKGLELLRKDHEIFNTHTSYIYGRLR